MNEIYENWKILRHKCVSNNEAKQFLEQFKEDFNQERFDKLVIDCKKEVINAIVTPFGLGKIVVAMIKLVEMLILFIMLEMKSMLQKMKKLMKIEVNILRWIS